MITFAQQCIKRRDHRLLCADIQREHIRKFPGIGMVERAQRAQSGGIEYKNIKLAPAFGHRMGQSADAVGILQIHRGDGRTAPSLMDPFFHGCQRIRLAGRQNHMGAGGGNRLCNRGPDPLARPGDKGNLT